MFMFDVETLGTESNSVILSIACIQFNPEEKPSYNELVDSAFFVKLDSKDQVERLNRTISKSTLEWWSGQPELVKQKSLNVYENDLKSEVGVEMFHDWVKKFENYDKTTVWARGSLDQMVINSLENKLQMNPIFPYYAWRDVRTAIDIYTGSNNGYCHVEHPEFDSNAVVKHDPVHDCALDISMLVYGK